MEHPSLHDSQEGDVCPICIDLYTQPVSLDCKHDYCLDCAKLLRKSKEDKTYYIVCPLCDEETDLGDDADLLSLPVNESLANTSDRKRLSENVSTEMEQLQIQLSKLNQTTDIFIPRNIKLLQEYDAAIGRDGKTFIPLEHTGMIGYGAEEDAKSDVDFMKLTNWHAMIIGPQESPIGQVIYTLKVHIPEDYPRIGPIVNFIGPKLVMGCIDETGRVHLEKIDIVDIKLVNNEGMVEQPTGKKFLWESAKTIADVLVAIRNNMHLRAVCTPSGSISQQMYV